MDLSELIKSYSMNQKSLFTAFVIALPVLFTAMYLYIPEFRPLELYIQAIFTCTASIILIFMYYLLILFCCMMLGIGHKPNIFLVLFPIFLSSLYLFLFPDSYGSGYRNMINVFCILFLYIAGFFIIASFAIRAVKILFLHLVCKRGNNGNDDKKRHGKSSDASYD